MTVPPRSSLDRYPIRTRSPVNPRNVEDSTDEATRALIQAAISGDQRALARLFDQFRLPLRRMVELRMDDRLKGRVDPSDVLQEAYLDLAAKLENFQTRGKMSFFLWLRLVTGERLLNIHRRHLNAEKRDVRRELSIHQTYIPQASSVSIAGHLIGNDSSASNRVIRAELRSKLRKTLDSMDEIDREIIALRHFEELSNVQIAEVLMISKTAASNRYIRAMARLKTILDQLPGFQS